MLEWLTDINKLGSAASVIGLVVTGFLFYEARHIKHSFLRRARLPEINKELAKVTSLVSSQIKAWDEDKKPALESFSHAKALLGNIMNKLPEDERKKVKKYLDQLQPRKYFFFKSSISELSKDSAFELYSELSGLVTSLRELAKDSRWD
ncbi:hypothetical protein [Aeromonas sp. EERV15]|uniref:hypothetical protein n=1 Tax=Aeromonas sp. EERV15 TaxID=1833892 RepID=UPI001146BA40|nr:hypothetical protein [Aeromonas sp. EERV15]